MKNTATISIEFYFKGQKYAPTLELDLDQHMEMGGCLPNLYPLLARVCNLGLYSYEYEMLQAEPISYSKASGLVQNHINNGVLDLPSFEAAWLEQDAIKKLKNIAKNVLNVADLSSQPELQTALLQAYQLGRTEQLSQHLSTPKN